MSPTLPSRDVGVVVREEIAEALTAGKIVLMAGGKPVVSWKSRHELEQRIAMYRDRVREALEWLRQGDRVRAVAALERTLL